MKRFNTISSLANVMEVIDYEIPAEKVGKYCVDTSHFVPKAEAEMSTRRAGDLANQGFYDFPDGKDSGARVPSSRSHSYTGDIAEASVNFKVDKAAADKSIQNAKEAFEYQQIIQGQSSSSNGSNASE